MAVNDKEIEDSQEEFEEELEEELDDDIASEDDDIQDNDEDDNEDNDDNDDSLDDDDDTNTGSPLDKDDVKSKTPEWVKELRKNYKLVQREKKELERKLEAIVPTETKPVELRRKPTIEDFDYDAEEFEKGLISWYEEKRKFDAAEEAKQKQVENEQKEWNSVLVNYEKSKTTLNADFYEEAELIVQDMFTDIQQSVILQATNNPAMVVYELGKNPAKAKALASEKNLVKLAAMIGKMEIELNPKSIKKAPPPEKKIVGTGPKSGTMDSTLKKLEAEADRTGDRTKVIQYKRKLQEQNKK